MRASREGTHPNGAAPVTAPIRLGLISDTHGLLRPQAVEFLHGCSRIVHGGDIGGPAILEHLNRVAPVTAVRGNNDGDWPAGLPETACFTVGRVRILAIHDLAQMSVDPVAQGIRVVISGHSHKPSAEERRGVLFVNPGSAGPRRFKLPIAVGELWIVGESVTSRLVTLA